MRERMRQRIQRVQGEFGLLDHTVVLDRVPQLAIREETARGRYRLFRERIVGTELTPILRKQKVIKIVHSKMELSLEDLRHEFCHFVHPDWSEQQVRTAIDRYQSIKCWDLPPVNLSQRGQVGTLNCMSY